MSITSTSFKCSKLLRLLRSRNPNSQFSFIHLLTEKPTTHQLPIPTSSSPGIIIAHILETLKSDNHGGFKDDFIELLSTDSHSLSLDQLIKFTRKLQNSPCPNTDSLSGVFEVVLELVNREPVPGDELFELVNAWKELGVPLTVNSATLLIKCFGKKKLVEKSKWVYNELEPQVRDLNVRNVLVDELLKNGRLDDALQVLDEMLQPNSEFPPDENTKEIVFEGLFKGEKNERRMSEDEIVELVSKFGSHGLFPDSVRLTKWIAKFCRHGRCDSASDLLDIVINLNGPVEVASFNALLAGLDKTNQYKKMNLLMQKMKDKGILPDAVTIGISINHLCNARRMDEALDLFEKMRGGVIGVDIKPDVIIYNTVLDGLCNIGRLEEALAFMRKMVSEDKCSPSASTYNCLIDGFCKAGKVEKSLELLHEMSSEGVEPNVITLNCMVDGMCKHGQAGSAFDFFKEMREKGLEGNKVTYTALIGGFCAVNNIKKAMELWDEMREKFTPEAIVYYTLISGLCLAGHMDEAIFLFSGMKSVGFQPDIGCYNSLISGFCTKNNSDKAHKLLKEMVRADIKPDSFTYNTLISYLSKNGGLKTANKLLKQMLKDNVSPTVVTYGAIIHGRCTAGELDEAMKIFWEMRSSARVPPNTVIYNTLITSLCENKKNVRGALSLLDDMKLKDVSPNAATFNTIFRGLQEEKWTEKALELMDRMIEEGCSPDFITLEILTEWLSGVGEADKLRKFVQGHKVSDSTTETEFPQFYGPTNLSKFK